MARIEYQELPNADKIKAHIQFGGIGETAAGALFTFTDFIATKQCWVHQAIIKTEVLGGAAATAQLKNVAPGEDYTSPATDTDISDAVDIGSGGDAVAGGQLSSDLSLPNNDLTTDEFNMDGQAQLAPFEMAAGGMLNVELAGANIAGFEGVIEVLISEQPM